MIDNFRRCALLLGFAAAALAADDWPMYLYDLKHSSFNPHESKIDKNNVGTLKAKWTMQLPAALAAGPTIVDGVIYVGDWDGFFYAIDAKTGGKIWQTFVGMAPAPDNPICQSAIGVTSQAVVIGDVVYVGGGDSAVYALDKVTGSQRWRVELADPASGSYLWSSVAAYNNALYIGIASLGDCPLVRGALVRIDLANPQEPLFRWLAPEDPTEEEDTGAGVWLTPAIDTSTDTVFVTTGTGNQISERGLWGGTMLSFDATTLEMKNYFFLPTNSLEDDIEWGSSVTLFESSQGMPMAAATGKDGILYAQHREDLAPAWQTVLAVGCIAPELGCGSLSTPAFDGHTLFVGAGAAPDADVDSGSVYAIDPDNGAILWRRLLNGTVIAPVTLANGLVYVSTLKGLEVFEAKTGERLFKGPPVTIFSQAAVSGGVVYSTQANGQVVAWEPVSP